LSYISLSDDTKVSPAITEKKSKPKRIHQGIFFFPEAVSGKDVWLEAPYNTLPAS
jgi:hypothetical protein